MNVTDARLEAQYEARDQDELPDETPMTDEEMQAMADYFNGQQAVDAFFAEVRRV